MPVLGTFGKGVPGSVSLNLNRSGGSQCDTACAHHPQSKAQNPTYACYAVRLERRGDRGDLRRKLDRHARRSPALIVGEALVELRKLVERGRAPPWLRLCTNGALPLPRHASPLFITQLRALLAYCKSQGIPVHIPVESSDKARFYRAKIGDLAIVRQSVQRTEALGTTGGAISFVAGSEITAGKHIRKRRIEAARTLAKRRARKTGRKTIVCPAVVVSFTHRSDRDRTAKAKCGNCTACVHAHIDVIYPIH